MTEKLLGKIVGLEIPPVGVRRVTIEVIATYEQWDEFRLGMGIFVGGKKK